jgi:hypothetical protein
MRPADFKIVSQPLRAVDSMDIDKLETELWIKLPEGYADYMTTLGVGLLSGFVRVYSPRQIRDGLLDWRRRIARYWFWDESEDVLPKERAVECVIIADTINGDELVFHPQRPGTLFVMPIDGGAAVTIEGDLLAAVDWMCSSGELVEPIEEREFAPLESDADGGGGESAAVDPEGESLDDVYELGKAWGKRHDVRKLARQALKKEVKPGQTTRVLYEGVLWEGDMIHGDGYVIAYGINDDATGLQVATFHFQKTDLSSGGCYVPNKENQKKIAEMKQK